jgi:hypothetical protein
LGSGQFGTPWERIQREKARSFWTFVDPAAYAKLLEPVDDGLPCIAGSRARPAAAVTAAAVRAVRGHGQWMMRVPWFIICPPQDWMIVRAVGVDLDGGALSG